MTLELLAADVIALLDKQKQYFNCTEAALKQPLLVECKQLESALRKKCLAIVKPGEKPKTLFDQIEELRGDDEA